jgi:hypothetical protein
LDTDQANILEYIGICWAKLASYDLDSQRFIENGIDGGSLPGLLVVPFAQPTPSAVPVPFT